MVRYISLLLFIGLAWGQALHFKNNNNETIKIETGEKLQINDNKYRLAVGPFKNFNALKTIYISLNNLGFEELNIYRE